MSHPPAGCGFRVLKANRRFREAFGVPEGRFCYQVYKQRAEKCEVCPVERSFADGLGHRSEERVTCLDGSDIAVIGIVRQTFEDGRMRVHEEVMTARDGRTMNVLVHTAPIPGPNGIDAVME